MSKPLHLTKLDEDEEIIFGPARRAVTSPLSVKSILDSKRLTHTNMRTVCITNKRIVVEYSESHLHFPNDDVQSVTIDIRKNKKDQEVSFNILQVRTKRGQIIKLDIPGILNIKKNLLAEIFPHAKIRSPKGLAGLLIKVFGE
ncbi:MAG: hypothetical protein N2D54_06625 [Chloroflexota bacterium]